MNTDLTTDSGVNRGLTTPHESKFAPQNFSELLQFSEMVANTDLVPVAYRKKPADIMVCIQYGAELNLQPMQALQNIAVINGRGAVWGDAVIAIAQSNPACEYITETFDDATMTATCIAKRRGHEPHVVTFSKEDATKAGLWGRKGPWQSYSRRMLQMRARGFCLRDKFPDSLRGFQTVEEVRDIPKNNDMSGLPHINEDPDKIYLEIEKEVNDRKIDIEAMSALLSPKMNITPFTDVRQIPMEFAQKTLNWLNQQKIQEQ